MSRSLTNVMTALLPRKEGLFSFRFASLALLQFAEKKGDIFNILWVLVFGFATLNILGLVARRFDSGTRRYSFGEILALLVVGVSVALLGWEMLTLFKIFPIRLHSQ
jgi:hypothetical protein